jgi:hypothetical protein
MKMVQNLKNVINEIYVTDTGISSRVFYMYCPRFLLGGYAVQISAGELAMLTEGF